MATLTPPTSESGRSPASSPSPRLLRSGRTLAMVIVLGAALLALVAGAVIALRDTPADGGQPAELMDRGFTVWAEDDAAGLRELYADDVVFVQDDGRTVRGASALVALLPSVPAPVRTGEIIETGPFAAAPYGYEGAGDVGILVIEVVDGRIVRQQLFQDRTP